MVSGLAYQSSEDIPEILDSIPLLRERLQEMKQFNRVGQKESVEWKVFFHQPPEDPGQNEILISYRGSASPKVTLSDFDRTHRTVEDWWRSNIKGIGLNNQEVTRRFRDMRTAYERVKTQHPHVPVTLVGHSLGGALAQWVAEQKGEDALVFNPGTTLIPNDPPKSVKMEMRRNPRVVDRQNLAMTPKSYFFVNEMDVASGLGRGITTRGTDTRHLITNENPPEFPFFPKVMPPHDWKSLVEPELRQQLDVMKNRSVAKELEQGFPRLNPPNPPESLVEKASQWFQNFF